MNRKVWMIAALTLALTSSIGVAQSSPSAANDQSESVQSSTAPASTSQSSSAQSNPAQSGSTQSSSAQSNPTRLGTVLSSPAQFSDVQSSSAPSTTSRFGSLQLNPNQQQPSIGTNGAPAQETLTLLKVFDLQHSDANGVATILRSIYKPSELAVVPDPRTGDVVLRGEVRFLDEAQVLLGRLDEPRSNGGSGPEGKWSGAPGQPGEFSSKMKRVLDRLAAIDASSESGEERRTVDSIRAELEKLEAKVAQLGTEIRAHKGVSQLREAQANELRQHLHRAFRLRQSLQRAELRQFLDRLVDVASTIELREDVANEIVDRRMNELLSEPVYFLDVSRSLLLGEAEKSNSRAADEAATGRRSQGGGSAKKSPPSFNFLFINAPKKIQWIKISGGATSNNLGTAFNLPSEKRSEFRLSGFSGDTELRAFVSVDIPKMSERVAAITSLNKTAFELTPDAVAKLKEGEVLTYSFWLPNDLTEAGEDLIVVSEHTAELAQRGTIVATLKIASDARKAGVDMEESREDAATRR